MTHNNNNNNNIVKFKDLVFKEDESTLNRSARVYYEHNGYSVCILDCGGGGRNQYEMSIQKWLRPEGTLWTDYHTGIKCSYDKSGIRETFNAGQVDTFLTEVHGLKQWTRIYNG